MKDKQLISALILVILISFSILCILYVKDSFQVKHIEETSSEDKASENIKNNNSAIKNGSFEKENQCQKYFYIEQEKMDLDAKNNLSLGGKVISVFYSPTLDSCLIYRSFLLAEKNGSFLENLSLYDILNEKDVMSKILTFPSQEYDQVKNSFEDKIKVYK